MGSREDTARRQCLRRRLRQLSAVHLLHAIFVVTLWCTRMKAFESFWMIGFLEQRTSADWGCHRVGALDWTYRSKRFSVIALPYLDP